METNNDFDDFFVVYELARHILNYSADVLLKSTAWRKLAILQLHLINEKESSPINLMNLHCLHRKILFNDNDLITKHIKNVEGMLHQLDSKTNLMKFTNSNLPNFEALNFPIIEERLNKFLNENTNIYNLTNASVKQGDENYDNSNTACKFENLQLGVKDYNAFISAGRLLMINKQKKTNLWSNATATYKSCNNINSNISNCKYLFNFAATKNSLGMAGKIRNTNDFARTSAQRANTLAKSNLDRHYKAGTIAENSLPLKNIDQKCVEMISQEIIQEFIPVDWSEIAGLYYAKSVIKEAVVYPLLRPDIFTGLRTPPRGILLFGPPGTGKTLIGKCIASQSKSTFFNISSSCLTSKWMGESEKMVRALFAVAVIRQPSVIFIDEVDSLLCQRAESENDATRRLKTEFLVRLDGAATSGDDRVLVVGATNRPQELDEAVRRRFTKRLYVSLPPLDARVQILMNLLKNVDNNLNAAELRQIAELTSGFSGADMDSLCREASMEPLRTIPSEQIVTFNIENIRPVNINDFQAALKKIRPSVSLEALQQYDDWNNRYGCSS